MSSTCSVQGAPSCGPRIEIGDASVPALGPPPTGDVDQAAIDGMMGAFAAKPDPADAYDAEMEADLARALDPTQRVKGADLGELAILVPGLGNIAPGAAAVLETAKAADRVVIAYTNDLDPAQNHLRPVEELGGVPLPEWARGRIWAIGSPVHNLISWEQSHDVLARQLAILAEEGGDAAGFGVDVLEADATIIAHSQGGAAALRLRSDLEAAGLDDVMGTLVTVSTPFGGGALIDDPAIGGAWVDGATAAAGTQGGDAMRHLSPGHMEAALEGIDPDLVDLSYSADTGASEGTERDPVVRKLMDDLARAIQEDGAIIPSDGVVAERDAGFGEADPRRLEGHRDHIAVWERGETVRAIAEDL